MITNNGNGGTGGGVLIRPGGAGTARGQLDNVKINGNIKGIQADGNNTTGTSLVHVNNSRFSGSPGSGVFVPPGHSMGVMLDRTAMVNNATGVNVSGAASVGFLSNSTVFGNSTGLQNAGGKIFS